jgi:hypothetical protein
MQALQAHAVAAVDDVRGGHRAGRREHAHAADPLRATPVTRAEWNCRSFKTKPRSGQYPQRAGEL